MSLYNTLFGVNPCAGTLLKMLGISSLHVPRIRDCFLKGNTIVIYTRTGGANRDDYTHAIAWLRSLPGFLVEHEESYDSTYACFAYSIPDEHRDACDLLRELGAERDPAIEWGRLLEKMRDPRQAKDPEVIAAVEKMRPTVEKLAASFKGDGPRVIEI